MRVSVGKAVVAVVALLVGLVGTPAAGAAAPADEFVFLQRAEAGSLDHLRDFSVAALGIHAHIYDPLVDMEGPDFTLAPKLATSWEVVNP
ncbi:MAG TPA: hypothetical protein VIM86_13555, partial [Thermodesulfobacteriota bacterium]